MAPRAKTTPAKGKSVSKSTKAGLQFPVGRIARYLKKGKYAERLGGTSSLLSPATTTSMPMSYTKHQLLSCSESDLWAWYRWCSGVPRLRARVPGR